MQTEAELTELLDPNVAYSGAVLLAVSVALAPAVAALVRRIYPGRNVFFARWGFSHVAVALVTFFVASMVLGSLVGSERIASSILWTLGTVSAVFSCVVAYVLVQATRLDPEGIASLGLRRGRNLRALFAGIVAYVLLFPGLYGSSILWPWTLSVLGESFEPQPFGTLFEQASSLELVLGVLFAVGIQPFLEELLYRGFLQPLLVQNFRDAGGIVLTSICFALPHGASSFLPIFVLSLLLGGVMLRTQRLLAVWGIHALHNGLQVLFLLNAP